jgi:hypothetical protein
VLDKHKGHAGIGVGRHAGEEGFEGGKSAGRRADADDGESANGGKKRIGLYLERDYGLLRRNTFERF